MTQNDIDVIFRWNEDLKEVIRRIDWEYLELGSRSLLRIENMNDYTSDPIGISMSQLRIFSFELRESIEKELLLEILELLNKYEKYMGKRMDVINPNIMTFYIIDFTAVINDIRDYLNNN